MSQWTSKQAISLDLSAVQGCVPVAIHRIVGADDKPPDLDIKEETEEEFFRHCTGEGDCNSAPDLGLIKHMLEIVREKDITSDEDNVENITMITKLNSTPDARTPCIDSSENRDDEVVVTSKKLNTKKKSRNVALASILKAIEDKNMQTDGRNTVDATPKLLKPNDVMSVDPELAESVEKVTGWLESQKEILSPTLSPNKSLLGDKVDYTIPVALEPTNMFKKKVPVLKVIKIEEIKLSVNNNNNGEVYKPSELADVYYNEYVDRVKLKEATRMDIWAKAEQRMKEIEAKRALDAVHGNEGEGDVASVAEPKNLDIVRLPKQRHLLTGECIVCEVMTQRGYIRKIDL